MKPVSNSLTKTILVVFLWIITIYKLYVDYDHDYLMNSLIHGSLIIIAGLVSAFVVYSDYSRYKQCKKLTSFISTATAFLCIAGLLLTTYFLKKQDDTPSIFYAAKNTAGFDGITIDFREDNTYKLARRHFMSTDYTRGWYSKKDSIIYLSNAAASEVLASDKFVLRTTPLSDSLKKKKSHNLLTLLFGKSSIDTTPRTFLFQINKKGEIIDSAISFRITQKPF